MSLWIRLRDQHPSYHLMSLLETNMEGNWRLNRKGTPLKKNLGNGTKTRTQRGTNLFPSLMVVDLVGQKNHTIWWYGHSTSQMTHSKSQHSPILLLLIEFQLVISTNRFPVFTSMEPLKALYPKLGSGESFSSPQITPSHSNLESNMLQKISMNLWLLTWSS